MCLCMYVYLYTYTYTPHIVTVFLCVVKAPNIYSKHISSIQHSVINYSYHAVP